MTFLHFSRGIKYLLGIKTNGMTVLSTEVGEALVIREALKLLYGDTYLEEVNQLS